MDENLIRNGGGEVCAENGIGRGPATAPSIAQEAVIRKVENGFIVQIGCKAFVSQSWPEVSEGLALFYSDTEAAYKKFLVKK